MESFQKSVCAYMPFKMRCSSCYCTHYEWNVHKTLTNNIWRWLQSFYLAFCAMSPGILLILVLLVSFVVYMCTKEFVHTYMCVLLILMLAAASCHHLLGSANSVSLWMMALASFSRCLMEEWAKASFPLPSVSLNPLTRAFNSSWEWTE